MVSFGVHAEKGATRSILNIFISSQDFHSFGVKSSNIRQAKI